MINDGPRRVRSDLPGRGADGSRSPGRGAIVSDSDRAERLRALEARLSAAQDDPTAAGKPAGDKYSQAQVAWRMVTELVAGVALGAGLGYGLDYVLGSGPWLLALLAILGFVAGCKAMMRTAKELTKDSSKPET